MNQNQLFSLKFYVSGFVLVLGSILTAAGKLEPTMLFTGTATVASALIVALGITGAGSAIALGAAKPAVPKSPPVPITERNL